MKRDCHGPMKNERGATEVSSDTVCPYRLNTIYTNYQPSQHRTYHFVVITALCQAEQRWPLEKACGVQSFLFLQVQCVHRIVTARAPCHSQQFETAHALRQEIDASFFEFLVRLRVLHDIDPCSELRIAAHQGSLLLSEACEDEDAVKIRK